MPTTRSSSSPDRTGERPVASRRTAVALGALALLVLLPAGVARADGQRRALVIGNDAYPGRNRLDSCVNDARAIRAWLLQVGYDPGQIDLVTDATRARMAQSLQRLVADAETNDLDQVVFYYSGHGVTVPDLDGDEGPGDTSDEALVGIDDPKTIRSWRDLVLLDDELYEALGRISRRCPQVIVIFDSCYSGGSLKSLETDLGLAPAKAIGEADLAEMLEAAGADPGPLRRGGVKAFEDDSGGAGLPKELGPTRGDGNQLLFIASSSPTQVSRPGKPLSAFTAVLLRALGPHRGRVAGPDGAISLDELRLYLESGLTAARQSPQLIPQALDPSTPFLPGLFRPTSDFTETVARLLALADEPSPWAVHAEPTQPGPLAVGTRFALRVRSPRDGRLVVLALSPGGELTLLVPNRFRPDNPVAAGEERPAPYANGLLIQPPVGREVYLVFVLAPELDPFSHNPTLDLQAGAPKTRLDDVSGRLQAYGLHRTPAQLRSLLERGPAPTTTPAPPTASPTAAGWGWTAVTVESRE